MKVNVCNAICVVLLLTAGTAVAQETESSVVRLMPCSLNNGYSMGDVVAVARDFSFSDNAPDAVIFREALYVSSDVREDFDFAIASVYPSYAELGRRRGAQRNAATSTNGIVPQDMMRCRPPFLMNSYIASEGGGFPNDQTLTLSQACELNGNSLTDAIQYASLVAGNFLSEGIDAATRVNVGTFGGRPGPLNERVIIRFAPSTATDMTTTMDLVRNGFDYTKGSSSTTPITCNKPNLWLSHRIFVRE